MKYDPAQIEPRWQQHWQQQKTFRTPNPDEPGAEDKPKFYVLDMFPYPSGAGLHVGHPLGYIATDIVARYKRMTGWNVLHPMGFDAFGLPAEQYAVETGVHPRETTDQNIQTMVNQLKRLGLGYDWDRQFATCDPDYYKWTQWIFLQLYQSWFDPEANAARPISELEAELANGEYEVGPDGELLPVGASGAMEPVGGGPIGGRKWHELSVEQQRNFLDEYRLAYMAEVPVNWCPALGTVLANEEVTNEGRSERGNHPVYQRPLKQWMLRITAYAERLRTDLDEVDWPEPIKAMQRNWIGRSAGAEVEFTVEQTEGSLTVFTTRPDTLFGATYMVLAPEHPLVESITTGEQYHAVNQYQNEAAKKTELERAAEEKKKTGVFTGAYAINPVNDQRIPIWIADYVMTDVGTGAIMAVPAHDERDHAFAKQYDLPIREVVAAQQDGTSSVDIQEEAFTAQGYNVNSANDELTLNGLETTEAKRAMIEWLEQKQLGRGKVQYKLRDWLFSRQRYWGEPFPILHDRETGQIVPVDEDDLPVELPEMRDFAPEPSDDPDAPPRPPLSRADESWRIVKKDGRTYERELNTMPQWAGSCWYYLRFCDPTNEERFVGTDAEHYWMRAAHKRTGHLSDPSGSGGGLRQAPSGGVDLYVGGVEHAVLHLLYARFWHKVLYDLGHVSTPEPFGRLFNQGYIQAYCYRDARGVAVSATEVVDQDGNAAADVQDQRDRKFFHNGEPVTQEYGKMGKSLKNALNPDDMCDQFGCDTLRLYEMYMGPLEQSKPWATRDVVGVHRFLHRLWRNLVDENTGELLVSDEAPTDELQRQLHKTIKRVTDDMERLAMNTAIAALIELNNTLISLERVPREVAETLVRLIAPMAPHIAEELWSKLGHEPSVAHADWPVFDESLLQAEQVELPVQVNGKVRSRITVAADADEQAMEDAARSDSKVQEAVGDATIRKVIVVKGRMVNIVAK